MMGEDIGKAGSEPAKSAAEPVAWGNFKSDGTLVGLAEERPDSWTGAKPLYAAPPAPSVAVKALEWEQPTGTNDRYANARSIVGQYRVRPKAGHGFELLLLMADTFPFYTTVEEAKAAAQADYEARIRSALSAQVQDVAGLLDETWNAAVEKAAAIANDCVHLTPDPGTAIRTMLNGRTKLLPAAPAKHEGGE